ncbi:7-carboxy-7-deazaguanine synthase [Gracilibacillus ureilyticus]|uniref:7-carboxy-7-deazaguanine synthase n=1 Tax=Gracilibacillus ureilyticus TaxID=531814 RepID=A0A1H9P7X8_9BACI|nr:7-carboxy-7-deazaguanine synthase QueE [Gracilibacillus ureilyticus]SER43889.1 7-carboxy-7-deazaguanine synthase [Gracilibacillus ureilyticus]
MNNRIPVLEIFGPTIQGEGMVIGRKTMFVRTAGCDYSCTWCDSAFTWDGSTKEEIRQMETEEVLAELKQIGGEYFDHVTISGGNPALFTSVNELIDLLHHHHIEVALETQGSRWQDWFLKVDDLTISPKPPSSGMETDWSVLHNIINRLKENNISLKVVIFSRGDLAYAEKVHQRFPGIPFYLQVGNDDIIEKNPDQLALYLLEKYHWLIDQVVASKTLNQVHVLPQLHALVWGNKRGV